MIDLELFFFLRNLNFVLNQLDRAFRDFGLIVFNDAMFIKCRVYCQSLGVSSSEVRGVMEPVLGSRELIMRVASDRMVLFVGRKKPKFIIHKSLFGEKIACGTLI